MSYLIDTNICIYVMNKKPLEVIDKFKNTEIGQIAISSITVSELNYGVAKSKLEKQNAKRLEEFLTPFEVLPYEPLCLSFTQHLPKRRRPILCFRPHFDFTFNGNSHNFCLTKTIQSDFGVMIKKCR